MEPPEAAPYCEVAVARPLLRTFSYALPAELRSSAGPGVRVLVPFGRRQAIGCIVRLAAESSVEHPKEVLDVLDDGPILPGPLFQVCLWAAGYYVAPPGLVLRAALPPGMLDETSYRVVLTRDPAGLDELALNAAEEAVVRRLTRASGPLRPTTLREAIGQSSVWPTLRRLEARGILSVEARPPSARLSIRRRRVVRLVRPLSTLTARDAVFGRAARQREAYELLESLGGAAPVAHLTGRLGFSRSVLEGLIDKELAAFEDEPVARDPLDDMAGEPEESPEILATPDQKAVIHGLLEQAARSEPGVALLRGVTGSGKTFVYLEVMERLVGTDGSAILLVPEIALTPQTVRRLRRRFGEAVAVLHSGLSAGERYDEWRALREGRKRIAVGPRSAIFAPLSRLRLIVVDEEHEGSYKQGETPRYHARALAAMRARREECLCLLGSATPSLESWTLARSGRYRLYELPERVTGHPLPSVELIDLRSGARNGKPASESAGPPIFSDRLRSALERRLRKGEQAILLLNRRGYSTFLQCEGCGHVWSCSRCTISLTYHRRRRRLVCHHCGYEAPPPDRCPACGRPEPTYTGLGTEQVERALGERFPQARIARMDLDTTGSKWAHLEILERVRRREVDILLGTQMIAKGLDFPNVTLVGVILADVGLNLPDFRASERTFQLLTQVAGRAGRGAEPGEVLVQTYRPQHFALRAAAAHDFVGFAEREARDRREARYPPFRRLANVVISGAPETAVAERAVELADWTRSLIGRLLTALPDADLEVLGPAPCPIERLRGRWRWHLLIRSRQAAPLSAALRRLAERAERGSGGMRVEIDRDPEALL